ncbi:MAG: hypothetical protein ACM30E_09545 [Nitrososphaerales archaeon]
MTEAGPLVQLQISLSRVPWRLAPAWSVLAGAFAAGQPLADPALWLRVVAAIVLGDLAWGILRRYVAASPGKVSPPDPIEIALPYAQPDSPVSALIRELSVGGTNWHGAFAGLILALGGALLLGLPAFVLSLIAVLITVVAWAEARRGDAPAACFALLDVLLPFVLGMLAAGWSLHSPLAWQPLLVGAAFTVLQWGVSKSAAPNARGRPGRSLAPGVLAVLVVLVGLAMPWAAAVAAVLLAPPLYWLGRDPAGPAAVSGTTVRQAASLAWAAPWLMLALFVAALALR